MTDELQISLRLEDEPDVVYPDSDEDVPEIDGLTMEPVYSEVQQALIAQFGSRDDVLVAGNSFIYYKMDGHPERTWLDCFVAFGVDRDAVRNRGCYYTWKIGKAPDFVLEIRTSMRACRDDRESIRHLYCALGITEYWILDATGAESGKRGPVRQSTRRWAVRGDGAHHRSCRPCSGIQPDVGPRSGPGQ